MFRVGVDPCNKAAECAAYGRDYESFGFGPMR
jgi:hypothetical protein